MKFFYKVVAYLLILLGAIHTALTPMFYNEFSLGALWFAGAGLALIYLGLLNIVAERIYQNWILTICIVANLIGTAFCVLIMFILHEIQAIIGLILFLAITISSIYARLSLKTGSS
ncbi:MAG: hypothetical protein GTO45_28295 [Candidatus Aminicenantes bacterium]|nr:hypothetical protein [Candidatus Aminicenantes bacterium]NIM82703.1 hypothetical protein [Candidatus Aminicenantes bacterium]NIN22074.1 hypothetical protein [Candidatus Aminicenantes bacterium]NIN45833.1 hypothetical protein [Candidatus Aminicenantes bacterium]NIN88670.1 hypothetical protein [Candidatus Aminicenantes bacterium]